MSYLRATKLRACFHSGTCLTAANGDAVTGLSRLRFLLFATPKIRQSGIRWRGSTSSARIGFSSQPDVAISGCGQSGGVSFRRGAELERRTAGVRYFDLAENPITRWGWHNSRHSLASWLVSNDFDVKTVSAILRHRNINTTLGIYSHAVDSRIWRLRASS